MSDIESWTIKPGYHFEHDDGQTSYCPTRIAPLPPVGADKFDVVRADAYQGAVGEIVWLRAVLKRVELGHAVPTNLARDAIRESETRLPLGGQ